MEFLIACYSQSPCIIFYDTKDYTELKILIKGINTGDDCDTFVSLEFSRSFV